ncbi:major facilitator superfamily protein (plasmid) [Rhizobium gallicum bv. gallicum R602sp]|uniref:Major facilitator superfamily protein n=1 Tax=Rhizobium gallicum bv. gallicum R602sp TaxID=1041138 RepID=A0A0B4XBQ2_9HYPH|nr:MFS transporter [Rhizobium gallicum]AJD43952.1 major facilitator superfamily protein [Rhizobium gallicum bv. gallicum R602sp]TDW16333.1 putative MFS family arabinose efflux permease [Rhizobium azibense]
MQREDSHSAVSATLTPLRNRAFRAIWTATQISSLGWLIQTTAISWLMATISASDLMVALVQASSTLPAFFLSILAGAIADCFSRRGVMLAGHFLIALASLTLAISVALGLVGPWLILGLGFLAGCGFALNDPAWHASVGDILEKRDIPAAVTLMSVGYNIVRSTGPAIGGAILAFFGPLAAFVLAALSDLVPLAAISRSIWHVRSSSLPRERVTTAIYDGLRFAAMSSEIRAAIVRGTLFGLASISILALLPLIVRDHVAGGPIVYGALLAAFGVGAFTAGLSTSHLRRIASQDRLIALASVACAACCFLLPLTASIPVAALALAIGGAGWLLTWTGIDVSIQLSSPRWVVGRTLSIYYTLASGGMAAGSWIWGAVAQNYSLTMAFEGAAVVLLLVAAAAFVLPIELWDEAEQEESDFEPPSLALDLKPRSGPIVVKVEYAIAEQNLEAFLECMRKRRRIQSQAGARNWTLQRNLLTPTLWTETFRTPTWTDYLRLNHRLSATDHDLGGRIAALHDGKDAPQTVLAIERATTLGHTRSQPITRVSRP